MVDLTRNPTPRECDYLRKRGQRDAQRFSKSDTAEFRSPHADEVDKACKAACGRVRAEYEKRVAQCGNSHESACDGIQRAKKAMENLEQPLLPSGEGSNGDYQDGYRNKLKRDAFEEEAAKSAAEAQSAKMNAEAARVQAMAAVNCFIERAACWLRPYCEGIYSVNPQLIEKLLPFDMPGMFGGDDDPFDFIDEVVEKHPSLFGGLGTAKSLEAARDEPKALDETGCVAGFEKIKTGKEPEYV